MSYPTAKLENLLHGTKLASTDDTYLNGPAGSLELGKFSRKTGHVGGVVANRY